MTGPDRGEADQPRGFIIASGQMFHVAVEAWERARNSGGGNPSNPLVAIVFAACSAEGFLNEISAIAADMANQPSSIALLGMVGRMLLDRESAPFKFHMSRFALLQEPYKEDEEPFQSFKLLFKLRNEVVHLKPTERFVGDLSKGPLTPAKEDQHSTIRGGLQRYGLWLPPPYANNLHFHWTAALKSPETELWACRTVRKMIAPLIEAIPGSPLRSSLDAAILPKLFAFPDQAA